MNAVTKVKDMTFAVTETCKYSRYFFFNAGWRRVQHRRIHITLQRDFIAHAAACIGDIRCPVEAQRIATGFCHRFQPLSAAFGKQRDRYAATVVFTQ